MSRNSRRNRRQLLRFLRKYQIPITVKEYATILDAVPSGIIMLLRGINFPQPLTHTVSLSDTVGCLCFSAAEKNKQPTVILIIILEQLRVLF